MPATGSARMTTTQATREAGSRCGRRTARATNAEVDQEDQPGPEPPEQLAFDHGRPLVEFRPVAAINAQGKERVCPSPWLWVVVRRSNAPSRTATPHRRSHSRSGGA